MPRKTMQESLTDAYEHSYEAAKNLGYACTAAEPRCGAGLSIAEEYRKKALKKLKKVHKILQRIGKNG